MHFQPRTTSCLSFICQDWHCTTILSLSQRLPKTFPSTKGEAGAIQDMLTVYDSPVFRFPWQYQLAAVAMGGPLVPCVGYIPGWGGARGEAAAGCMRTGTYFLQGVLHMLVEVTTLGLHCYRCAMVLLHLSATHFSFFFSQVNTHYMSLFQVTSSKGSNLFYRVFHHVLFKMHVSHGQIYRRLRHHLSVGGAAAPSAPPSSRSPASLCRCQLRSRYNQRAEYEKKSLRDLSSAGWVSRLIV